MAGRRKKNRGKKGMRGMGILEAGGAASNQTGIPMMEDNSSPSNAQMLQNMIDELNNVKSLRDPQIVSVENRTVRVVRGLNLITKSGEFKYADGRDVPNGTRYHIHYTRDLKEYYMTHFRHNMDISKLIYRTDSRDDTDFATYSSLSKAGPLLITAKTVTPTKPDYEIGSYFRYFASRANESSSKPFEVDVTIFNTSPLYDYVKLRWHITGKKNRVRILNNLSINKAEKKIKGLKKLLSVYQFYRPPVIDRLNPLTKEDLLTVLTTGGGDTEPAEQLSGESGGGSGDEGGGSGGSAPPSGGGSGGGGGGGGGY